MRILYIFLLVGGVLTCNIITNIKEKLVDIESITRPRFPARYHERGAVVYKMNVTSVDVLSGVGLHRNLQIQSKISSIERFSECRILYKLNLPAGAYIDVDSVNASLYNHFAFSSHHFDVEAPEQISKPHSVFLLSKMLIRRSFVIEDSLNLPVKIRYHQAKIDNLEGVVTFETPSVYLDCNDIKTNSCKGKKKIAEIRNSTSLDLSSTGSSWISLEPLAKRRISTKIPVGNKLHSKIVVSITFALIFISLFVVLTVKPKENIS